MTKEMKKTNRRHDHANSTTTLADVNHLVENAPIPLDTQDRYQGYECKTCRKRFITYQALGGHQGIHKKVKPEEDNNDESWLTLNILGSSKSSGLHTCKLCMKRFPTGQALGGHMGRHRPEKEGLVLMEADHGQQVSEEEKVESDLSMVEVEPLRIKVYEEDDRFIAKRELILAAREWRLSL